MGAVLAGSGRPFVFASGVVGLVPGRVATEEMPFDPKAHPRAANAVVALGLAERGVRVSAIRLAPTVHGPGDHGFVKVLVDIARDKGVSGYIGDGAKPLARGSSAGRRQPVSPGARKGAGGVGAPRRRG